MNHSSSCSSSSAAAKKSKSDPELLREFLDDIFSRLPVQAVLSCKLVSKGWLKMTRHNYFAEKHLQRQLLGYHHFDDDHKYYYPSATDGNKNVGRFKIGFLLAVCKNEDDDDEYEMSYEEYNSQLRIITTTPIKLPKLFITDDVLIGSCNGLICIARCYSRITGQVYICNPLTRECVYLPELESSSGSQGYVVFGFGYIANSMEYKVVRVVYSDHGGADDGLVQVYTIGSGDGWRDKETTVARLKPQPGAFIDGAIHWLDSNDQIHAFDLKEDKFHILKESQFTPAVDSSRKLVVLGGWLSILESGPDAEHMWCFRKSGEKDKLRYWSNDYSHPTGDCFLIIYGLTRMGELVSVTSDGYIAAYDEELQHTYELEKTHKIYNGILHINSFISLRDLGEENVEVIKSE